MALKPAVVIDVSGSVGVAEFNLQRNGYSAAFQNAAIGNAIASFSGSRASRWRCTSFVEHGASHSWIQLTSAADAFNFGTLLGGLVNPPNKTAAVGGSTLGNNTNIAEGMDLAREGMAANSFTGNLLVMGVSGDGIQNTTADGDSVCGSVAACVATLQAARNAAALAGIVVNGLAITDDMPDLDDCYAAILQTGLGSFVLDTTFGTFNTAVAARIGREITGTLPAPTSLALAGLAFAGLGAARRRRAA